MEEDDVAYPCDIDKNRKVDEEQLISIESEDHYGVAFMMDM